MVCVKREREREREREGHRYVHIDREKVKRSYLFELQT